MSEDKYLKEKIAELKKKLELLESVKDEEAYFKKRSDITVEIRKKQMIVEICCFRRIRYT